MARPSSTDQSKTKPRARNARPKIERAALKLFIHEGIDAATTREIAEKAGVSEGALYRHYKGKDELALSLFMETHNRLGAMMAQAHSKKRFMQLSKPIVPWRTKISCCSRFTSSRSIVSFPMTSAAKMIRSQSLKR